MLLNPFLLILAVKSSISVSFPLVVVAALPIPCCSYRFLGKMGNS